MICSAFRWPSGSYTVSRSRRPSTTMRNISNRLVLLEPMGLLADSSKVMCFITQVPRMPVRSQRGAKQCTRILSGSWRTVKTLLLAIRYVKGHLPTSFACRPSNALLAVNRPPHLMLPKLPQRPWISCGSALRKILVHTARVCGQARAACTSCPLKHLSMYECPGKSNADAFLCRLLFLKERPSPSHPSDVDT